MSVRPFQAARSIGWTEAGQHLRVKRRRQGWPCGGGGTHLLGGCRQCARRKEEPGEQADANREADELRPILHLPLGTMAVAELMWRSLIRLWPGRELLIQATMPHLTDWRTRRLKRGT